MQGLPAGGVAHTIHCVPIEQKIFLIEFVKNPSKI